MRRSRSPTYLGAEEGSAARPSSRLLGFWEEEGEEESEVKKESKDGEYRKVGRKGGWI